MAKRDGLHRSGDERGEQHHRRHLHDNGAETFTWPDGGMTPFRASKGTIYEAGFRVPAIIRWPGHVQPGSVENGIFSGLDWYPTFVAATPSRSFASAMTSRKSAPPASPWDRSATRSRITQAGRKLASSAGDPLCWLRAIMATFNSRATCVPRHLPWPRGVGMCRRALRGSHAVQHPRKRRGAPGGRARDRLPRWSAYHPPRITAAKLPATTAGRKTDVPSP
jgi:hypothetical protein